MRADWEAAVALLAGARRSLDALAKIVVELEQLGERDHELRYLAGLVQGEPAFELRAVRVGDEAGELRARLEGQPSPRSLRLQDEADEIAKAQRTRLAEEVEYSRRHNWEPTVPPRRARR